MTGVKGVVFDWGGVIIDEPGHALQVYCSQKLGLPLNRGSAAIRRYLPMYQEGRVSERRLWEMVCADCRQQTAVIPGSSLWGEALRAVFRFRSEVLLAIEQLAEKGFKVGFLSNTEPEAAAYFHERKMDALFSASVLSCEVGISKPNPDIYLLVAEQMAILPAALLMLDDRQENIDGARQAGMQALRVGETGAVLDALRPFLHSVTLPR